MKRVIFKILQRCCDTICCAKYRQFAVMTLIFVMAGIFTRKLPAQTISRGHQILLQRGLQLNAFAHGPLNLNVLDQSNFTTVFMDNIDVQTLQSLGPAPGLPWGRLFYTGTPSFPRLTPTEVPYQSNLVSMQLNDELDIADQTVLDEARFVLDYWRFAHPNSIGYLNQYAPKNTTAELRNYMTYVKPDMMMFDYYPFNNSLADGSPTDFYSHLQKFRQLGLGGIDGTGQLPIPTGLYLQTFTDPAHLHLPSPSETRFNQFSAWTFGYKYATAITYSGSNTTGTHSTLFVGEGDSIPREPQFSAMAETNRQSRNLGPALVQLISTDVRIRLGQHKLGSSNVSNAQPDGVPLWGNGAGGNPYLTAVGATNIGGHNSGLPGDVVIGHFKPLEGPNDLYFMVLNGLSIPSGTLADAAQRIRLAFNFGTSSIDSLLRLNRNTGLVEVVSLIHDVGSLYHLDLILEGGTGDLFKYNNGTPFLIPEPTSILLIVFALTIVLVHCQRVSLFHSCSLAINRCRLHAKVDCL